MPVPALRSGGRHPPISCEMVPLGSIKENPKNARLHPLKQVAALMNSVADVGFIIPVVVDENNELLAGHARVLAAKNLGLAAIPAIRVKDLNEAQKRGFSIADNRLTELATWDKRSLQRELRFLSEFDIEFDFSAIGFDTAEVEFILEYDFERDPKSNNGARGRAKTKRRRADTPSVSQFGDIWCLGSHLIYCGRTEPRQVDSIVRRWQTDTGGVARDLHTGQPFSERELARGGSEHQAKGDRQ